MRSIKLLSAVAMLGFAIWGSQGMAMAQMPPDYRLPMNTSEPAGSAAGAGNADEGQTYALQSLGAANSVASIDPTGGRTVLSLRDGSVLVVPPSVNLPSNLQEGSWIRSTFERINGENIVSSLDVVGGAGQQSHSS